MAIRYWLFCAVMITSVNPVYAAEGNSQLNAAPAPFSKDPANGIAMVYVKGGCFQMGATNDDCDANPEERPAHEVCVDDFYLGKYEVTQGQWKLIMGYDTATSSTCAGDECPVDNVSWSNVQDFVNRLNGRSGGSNYRLPTEAEWEYAARSGGKPEKYSGGNTIDRVAWYAENSGRKNHPVGAKAPNGLGIYDMSGNVWEMTNDWYESNYYKKSPRNNPSGPDSGVDRVVRGGSVTGGFVTQRVSRRTRVSESTKGKDRGASVGFRLLMTPDVN